jgi:hypothetical protein
MRSNGNRINYARSAKTAAVIALAAGVNLVATPASAASGYLVCGAQRTIFTSSFSSTSTTHTHWVSGYNTYAFYAIVGRLQANWPTQGGSWSANPDGGRGCR